MLPHEAATFLKVLTTLCLVALGLLVALPRVGAGRSNMEVHCAITGDPTVLSIQAGKT